MARKPTVVCQSFRTGAAAFLLLIVCTGCAATKPAGENPFVDLATLAPTIHFDLRYGTSNNFLGRRVIGYERPRCLLTAPAAHALSALQSKLEVWDLSLLVYDCYRPQRAVNDFVRWSKHPDEAANKNEYFPNLEKEELFQAGYIAERQDILEAAPSI